MAHEKIESLTTRQDQTILNEYSRINTGLAVLSTTSAVDYENNCHHNMLCKKTNMCAQKCTFNRCLWACVTIVKTQLSANRFGYILKTYSTDTNYLDIDVFES